MKKIIFLGAGIALLAFNAFSSSLANTNDVIKTVDPDPPKTQTITIYGEFIGLNHDGNGNINGVTCKGGPPKICFRITTIGPRLEVDLGDGTVFPINEYSEEPIDENTSHYIFR